MRTMTVEQWNEECPEGTLVLYRPIRDEPMGRITRTRSKAWALGHGDVVVQCEGESGGLSVNHLTILTEKRVGLDLAAAKPESVDPLPVMEIERARELARWCMESRFYAMGVRDKGPGPWPEGVTLAEMVEANRVVGEHNDRQLDGDPDGDAATRTVQVRVDDRAVAAIYVACNYQAEKNGGSIEPAIVHKIGERWIAVAVIDAGKTRDSFGEDD